MLDKLLGLNAISLLDENTHFAFAHALPAWLWVLIILGAVGFAGWSYHHLMGPRWTRGLFALMRGLLVLIIVVLLCKPEIVRRDEKVEQDWLLVLVDRSASMQVRDTPAASIVPVSNDEEATADDDDAQPAAPAPKPEGILSRDEALLQAIQSQAEVFSDERLGKERKIHVLGFGGQAFNLPEPWGGDGVKPADAPATALRTAIEQALQEAAGHPISGIVLITDGQSPQSTGADLVRRLDQHAVSVFAVPVGADTLPLDLAVARVDAPQRAFVNDFVPVSVVVDRIGGEADQITPENVVVRLVDADTGDVLDEQTLAGKSFGEEVRLRARSSRVGPVKWKVEVEAGGGDEELLTTNNVRAMSVEMIDRPIRVLYVEGYPRWEYRYLKNMLIREKSIDSSMLLLTADRAFAQEGDTPITRMPDTAEEFRAFDVIILGDVPAGYFSARQIALMKDHVSGGGAGLLWIAGERYTPVDYAATALSDLLPMRRPASVARLNPDLGEIDLLPTPAAEQLAILELTGPAGRNAVVRDLSRYGSAVPEGWPTALPPLQWAQNMGELKPTSEVLAHWPTPSATIGVQGAADLRNSTIPLLARLRYGAGQSVYVGTDETWRWRYGRGEMYFEQFWIQLVRMLGRDRVQQSGQRARLVVAERRMAQGQSTMVSVTLDDAALISRELDTITVDVFDGPDADARAIDRIELRPVTDTEVDPELGDTRVRQTFRAAWRARAAGQLDLRVSQGALAELDLRQPIEVIAPDDEWRQPKADHARLVSLSDQTGGEVVALNELSKLEALIPNRARRTPDDLREPIWNSALALILVLGLLTAEWIGRKLIKLV